jgi:hypothetical protein
MASRSIVSWRPQDLTPRGVGRILCSISLGEYVEIFARYPIDGPMLLNLREDEMKTELGMTKAIHRKRLIDKIAELKLLISPPHQQRERSEVLAEARKKNHTLFYFMFLNRPPS